ncbi:hypothetical protein ACFPRL_00650 [Pseudoclavibacter helvolus]
MLRLVRGEGLQCRLRRRELVGEQLVDEAVDVFVVSLPFFALRFRREPADSGCVDAGREALVVVDGGQGLRAELCFFHLPSLTRAALRSWEGTEEPAWPPSARKTRRAQRRSLRYTRRSSADD